MLRLLTLLRAGPSQLPTTSFADFCSVVRLPLDSLSRSRDTVQISHGKFDHFHRTLAEFTPADFDSYGLCHHLLARPIYIRLISSFCTSSRDFARRFLQTQPRDYALALCYSSPLSGSVWTFTSSYQTCVAHKKSDVRNKCARQTPPIPPAPTVQDHSHAD